MSALRQKDWGRWRVSLFEVPGDGGVMVAGNVVGEKLIRVRLDLYEGEGKPRLLATTFGVQLNHGEYPPEIACAFGRPAADFGKKFPDEREYVRKVERYYDELLAFALAWCVGFEEAVKAMNEPLTAAVVARAFREADAA